MGLQRLIRPLLQVGLGFYFGRIEHFHPERVPVRGPLLLVANHPNSLTDAFLIGTVLPRRVHFVATVQLFRNPPLAWFLRHCQIIPVNRVTDNPQAMRSVLETFEKVFAVLEMGEAVGIFPEGISHAHPQLKQIKSGAARLALDLEHRHQGSLGLSILPIGLTFSDPTAYRSQALVHFGIPFKASEFLTDYEKDRKKAVSALTDRIEAELQSLMVHLSDLARARTVEGVRTLYLERLDGFTRLDLAPVARELVLIQEIVRAVEHFSSARPTRFVSFEKRLWRYLNRLRRLHLSDSALQSLSGGKGFGHNLLRAVTAIIGAPLAVYGWLHRLIPVFLVRWSIRNLTDPGKQEIQTSSAAIISGLVAFPVCYGIFFLAVHQWAGWPLSFWYLISLPISGLIAHYYFRELRKLRESFKAILLLLRRPIIIHRLVKTRYRLLYEMDQFRDEYLEGGLRKAD